MSEGTPQPLAEAYVELLKRAVLGETAGPVTVYQPVQTVPGGRLAGRLLNRVLEREEVVLAKPANVDLTRNEDGGSPYSISRPGR